MTPRPITKGASYQLIHPLSSSHNVFLSHSIPVYKTEKFRFALLWRQYMTTKFARSHFGISLEHKLLQNYRLKMQLMTGTTSIVNAEFSKMLKNHYEVLLNIFSFFWDILAFWKPPTCTIRFLLESEKVYILSY